MKFTDRYNMMIDIIEENISSDNEVIESQLSRNFGENIRLLADAFKFISGRTLSRYIRERKLVNVILKKRLEGISFDEAADHYGFSDAASFSKSARTCFGKAPTQITDAELESYGPLTMEKILDNDDSSEREVEYSTPFGVTAAQFYEISKTLSVAAVYGLSDDFAELAYSLSKSLKIPLEKACDFVSDYALQIENGTLLTGFPIKELAQLSYCFDLSYSEAQTIMYELECAGINSIENLPDLFFDIYFSEENEQYLGLDVKTICKIAEAMEQKSLGMHNFFDIIENGNWFYDGDYLEAIENFESDDEQMNSFMDDAMTLPAEEHRRKEEMFGDSEYY